MSSWVERRSGGAVMLKSMLVFYQPGKRNSPEKHFLLWLAFCFQTHLTQLEFGGCS